MGGGGGREQENDHLSCVYLMPETYLTIASLIPVALPVLRMRKRRPREVTSVIQHPTASKWPSQASDRAGQRSRLVL